MLKQRVITATLLVVLLLGAAIAPTPWAMVLIFCVLAACAVWEWLRLSLTDNPFIPLGIAVLFFVTSLLFANQWITELSPNEDHKHLLMLLSPPVLAYWIIYIVFMVIMAQSDHRRSPIVLSLFGVGTIAVAWAALVDMWLYRGAFYLLTMLMVVWVADIAAYFGGKAFGKRKLAPRVSPGKTWEGLICGVLAVVIWIFVSAQWPGSFGAELFANWSITVALFLAVFMAVYSVVGDLFESLLKRRVGVKDSSQLLPGHGGVLDRVDALLPVAPIAALVAGPWFHVLVHRAA